ncbi:MAG: hypothetical protein GY944_16795 [bacterium]|nr:hypothetical protein [bacterium]
MSRSHSQSNPSRSQWLVFGLALSIGLGASAARADSHEVQWLKPVMRDVFTSMSYLLPRSIDRERFASEKERAAIAAHIDSLATSAAKLEHHGLDRGSSLSFLGFSLARDVEEVRMRYKAGLYEEARYFLVGSIQNCFACHSRRPSKNRFAIAEQLTDAVELEKLSATERALLYVVTRRFREAIDTWEEVFRDLEVPARELDDEGVLFDYLAIAVRGLGEYGPTRKTLEDLARRKDVSAYLETHLAAWITSLKELEKDSNRQVSLEHARELVNKAGGRNQYAGDRHGLVDDLAASSLLNQLTDRPQGTPGALDASALSEAYYLLGMIESRSMTHFWIDESSNHLEAAVRVEPKSPHARMAFGLFEENMISGYGAISEYDLPTDVWVRLETLRKLVDPESTASDAK